MDHIALREQEKYEEVWRHPEYRQMSPGLKEVNDFWLRVKPQPNQSLNDYGAGACHATAVFSRQGLNVLAIDIAGNAREHPQVPFVQACLWDMGPAVSASDYGYCCDVMEHIPPHYVLTVIEAIARRTKVAAWFRIATAPDRMGPKLVNEPLHLTVETDVWWHYALLKSFKLVTAMRHKGHVVVFDCRP